MTAHLLLVTLGPVQDFIAQARRTRDLWYGSHMLSELGRAAARALVGGDAQLIFPALAKNDPELAPCLAPLRPNGQPPQNIPNKLLAEVPSGTDPEALARTVREAVMCFWRDDLAAPVKAKCAKLLTPNLTDDLWNEQIETLLEFTASWLPLGDYATTRRQLEQAVAGRKLLRDFSAWRHQRGNVPKSSLDGGRETVLAPPEQRSSALVHKYRITAGEQLDAVGLVKRAGGEPDQFVSVVNIALASWIACADQCAKAELEALRAACKEIGLARVSRHDLPCAAPFPFDASVFFPNRWKTVFEEQGLPGYPNIWGNEHVRPMLQKAGEPYPYVACLVADGDHMGRAISSMASAADHRAFSRALAGFAQQARQIIEQQHRGVLVYAGGDDVLAFLPLPEALACAENLCSCFAKAMASACTNIASRPTLSIGLGVGHLLESLGELLALGRSAERRAKDIRNALAIIVEKRSGNTYAWRASWNDQPVSLLNTATQLLAQRLSSRKVYEIANLLERLPKPVQGTPDSWSGVLAAELRWALARTEEGGLAPEDVGLQLDHATDYPTLHACVRDWVERLLVARTFARALPQKQGRSKANEVSA